MARKIKVQFKRKLSEIIGIGHSRFGRVALRKPYRDDDAGGEGGADMRFASHPLFANLPDGADSDLSAQVNNNPTSQDAIKERANEANPELKLNPVLQAELQPGYRATPTPHPGG
jgi:hypothetical protein